MFRKIYLKQYICYIHDIHFKIFLINFIQFFKNNQQMKLRRNPISWILETVCSSYWIIFLTFFWTICVLASILEVNRRTTASTTTSNSMTITTSTMNSNSTSNSTTKMTTKMKGEEVKVSTDERKFFHGLVVIVFTTGVLIDRNFIFFASTIVLAIQV